MLSCLMNDVASGSATLIFVVILLAIVAVAIMSVMKKYKESQERSRQRERDFLATYEKAMLEAKAVKQQSRIAEVESQATVEEKQTVTTIKMNVAAAAEMQAEQELVVTEKIDHPVKMVVLDGNTLNPGDISWKRFEKFGELVVYDRSAPEQIAERIGDAEIAFTNKSVLTEEVFAACPNLKYVGVNATGYNVVDTKAAKEHGVVVTNVPAYGTDSVAQFTFALILELCNQVAVHNQSVQMGAWKMSQDFSYHLKPLVDLTGKTLGIVGYGAIGSRVAEIAKVFGMKILVYSRTKKQTDDSVTWVSLDELLAQSDIVTLHCPLTEQNKEFMNKAAFDKMKKGAKLINTARGGLIDEADLVAALKSGQLSGAALDVVSQEPMAKDTPLLSVDNLIITPHIAWASKEARQRLMDMSFNNLESFLNGQAKNCVNP